MKSRKALLFASAALIVSACYDDSALNSRLDELDGRLTAVEETVKSMNSQLSTLQDLISGKKFITDVSDYSNGSHVITLVTADGAMSTITIKDGEDGKDGENGKDGVSPSAPQISVKQAPDGKYYWAVDGEWVLVNGEKVPVTGPSGVTPALKIENGMWYVSYDNGITYVVCGPATGADGDAFFKSAELSEDGRLAFLTLVDGTVLTFEIYRQFGLSIDMQNSLVLSGHQVKYPYLITGADEQTDIEVYSKNGWEAEIEKTDVSTGYIVVSAPEKVSKGKITVLATDGADKTIMRTLTVISGHVNLSSSSVEAPEEGGLLKVAVSTNLIGYEAKLSEGCEDWLSFVNTKVSEEVVCDTLTLSVKVNEFPQPRQASISILYEGNQVESILVYQMPKSFPEDALVLIVKPLASDGMVMLPTYPAGTTEYTVDWGDGSEVEKFTTKCPQHLYEDTDRTYAVAVRGTLQSISKPSSSAHYSDVIEVAQWGDNNITTLSFNSNASLVRVAAPKGNELKNVTTVRSCFYGCKSLKEVPSNFFRSMGNITSLYEMFKNCYELEYLPDDLFDDLSCVTGTNATQSMFNGCHKLKRVPSCAGLGVKGGTISCMNQLFNDCWALEEIPEHYWPEGFESATGNFNFNMTFRNCKALKSIPESFFEHILPAKVVQLNNTFYGCESLTSEGINYFFNKYLLIYNWNSAFYGCKSLTTLPEYELTITAEDGSISTVSVPVYKRNEAEYQAYFAGKSYSSISNCFKGCVNLEGYYDKIPLAWGGGWDGSTEAPVIDISAVLPEKKGYYAIDFIVKGTGVAEAYYYLSAKTLVDQVLPNFNNSYSELCEQKGIKIEDAYLSAINSTSGLTLGFEEGVPDVEYILIVSGKNIYGKKFAYCVQSTTSIPKGSDEYDRFLGDWKVTSSGSVSTSASYDGRDVVFNIRIEPYRVDESYLVYNWGITKFTGDNTLVPTAPTPMFFENGTINVYTGAANGSVIYMGYNYTDEAYGSIDYNVALNTYSNDVTSDGTYSVYMTSGEKVASGVYNEDGTVTLDGVLSAMYEEMGHSVKSKGFDYFLAMGGPGWSRIFIPEEVVKPEFLFQDAAGNNCVPYALAPYKLEKISGESTPAAPANLSDKSLKMIMR